jgi:type IV pilus assembly protein PilP
MITTRLKVSTIFCMVAMFALLLNPICEARTTGKPLVVRKKIIIAAEDHQKEIMPELKSDLSDIDPDTEDDTNMDMETAVAVNKAPGYDPAGKIDPFEPMIKGTPKDPSQKATYADTDTQGDTPLEKIDLSQLKLSGIVRAASGNKGLVREASGRGYIIVRGTRIGTHGGRVAEVLNDRIVIKEKMKDVLGRIFFQNTEMKLHNG